jgi:hypothetical protein
MESLATFMPIRAYSRAGGRGRRGPPHGDTPRTRTSRFSATDRSHATATRRAADAASPGHGFPPRHAPSGCPRTSAAWAFVKRSAKPSQGRSRAASPGRRTARRGPSPATGLVLDPITSSRTPWPTALCRAPLTTHGMPPEVIAGTVVVSLPPCRRSRSSAPRRPAGEDRDDLLTRHPPDQVEVAGVQVPPHTPAGGQEVFGWQLPVVLRRADRVDCVQTTTASISRRTRPAGPQCSAASRRPGTARRCSRPTAMPSTSGAAAWRHSADAGHPRPESIAHRARSGSPGETGSSNTRRWSSAHTPAWSTR